MRLGTGGGLSDSSGTARAPRFQGFTHIGSGGGPGETLEQIDDLLDLTHSFLILSDFLFPTSTPFPLQAKSSAFASRGHS